MGKTKNTAPAYPTTTTNMGPYGSVTTSSSGSTWNPTAFQTQYVNSAENQITNAQNALTNPSLSEQRINDLNAQTQQQFQNNFIMPAMQKGLLRGSTAQDLGSVMQKNYANAYQSALDAEEARNQQRLQNALAQYTTLYDMAAGTTGVSNALNQSVANYNLSASQMQKPTFWASMMSGLGDMMSPSITVKKSE